MDSDTLLKGLGERMPKEKADPDVSQTRVAITEFIAHAIVLQGLCMMMYADKDTPSFYRAFILDNVRHMDARLDALDPDHRLRRWQDALKKDGFDVDALMRPKSDGGGGERMSRVPIDSLAALVYERVTGKESTARVEARQYAEAIGGAVSMSITLQWICVLLYTRRLPRDSKALLFAVQKLDEQIDRLDPDRKLKRWQDMMREQGYDFEGIEWPERDGEEEP